MTTRIASTALVGAALLAVSVTQGWAGCLKPPASDQAISQFRANPQGLVAPNSDTRTIEVTTRDLAGTDASLAADIIRVAEGTSPRFQTAIAAGLAQAAIACATVDQQAANPNGSSRSTVTPGGGGGVSALGQLTAGAASTTPNSTSPTAAVPVSATR